MANKMEEECIKCCKSMGKDMNRIALGNGLPVYIHTKCEKEYWESRKEREKKADKLKTLKDLVFENVISYGQDSLFWTQKDDEDKKFVFPEMLRNEALNWIKAFKTEMLKYESCTCNTVGWMAKEGLKSKIALFKDFFNITDTDVDALVSGDEQ